MLIILLSALLFLVAWGDVRRRIIPNRLNIIIALAAPVFWWAEGLALWPGVAAQLALALAVFAAFAGLFSLGLMGGGDVKLIGALALWVPPAAILNMLVLTAFGGGLATLATLVVHWLRHAEGQAEVPYGVAIAAAAILCLGQPYIYHFA
ncbi:prepilin peptidase [Sphingomonas sp. XMGL2]|uniref:Prepilin peptidase n=2 Tax=Sphingomonas quercus TaxID=2842451 RepID=A0ABS6BML3_9SPHN|nr:prepilin peptidase [Sphingomonas quercus]